MPAETTPPDTTAPDTTTTQPLECRNSYDPRCGAFYWDPQPANEPLTLDLTVSSTSVHTGEPITVTVHAADPDADVIECPRPGQADVVSADTAEGCQYTASGCGVAAGTRTPSGPWDPPPPAPSDKTWTYTVTFTTPGTKQIAPAISSGPEIAVDQGCPITNPYSSSATRTVTITVT